jgi:short-subunit dehydrogenase
VDAQRYGPWAVVAGGSEGLGAAFAEQLVAAGIGVVLLGRKIEPLQELAASLEAQGGKVRALSVDLSRPDALDRVRPVTDDLDVGLLIYNAGANSYGSEFVEGDLERFQLVIDVNTRGRLLLCQHYGKLMKDRGRGGLLLIGSMAGYRGSPWNALYNAAKAFTRVFAEGLWYELKDHGVDVVEFVVGGIRTPAMVRRGMKIGPGVSEPDDVAREGLAHLGDGPVWVSELAGGEPTADHLNSFPRSAIVTEAAENLVAIGLYPPK